MKISCGRKLIDPKAARTFSAARSSNRVSLERVREQFFFFFLSFYSGGKVKGSHGLQCGTWTWSSSNMLNLNEIKMGLSRLWEIWMTLITKTAVAYLLAYVRFGCFL